MSRHSVQYGTETLGAQNNTLTRGDFEPDIKGTPLILLSTQVLSRICKTETEKEGDIERGRRGRRREKERKKESARERERERETER